MSYKIFAIPRFEKDLKRLAKKYRSIKDDLAELGEQLLDNPTLGDEVIENCYKIRLAITSKGKGKSSGARVITYVYVEDTTVFLLSIYDKSDQENIDDSEIRDLLKDIHTEDERNP